MDYKKINVVRDWTLRYFLLFFGLVFYTSWLYEVQALGGHAVIFGGIKHVLMFGLMASMLLCIQWRNVRFDAFTCVCGFWLLINIFVWIEYQNPFDRYFRTLQQTIFVYLFITFLRQNPDKNPCMPRALDKWFSPRLVFIVLTVLIVFNVTGYLGDDLEKGFGNSRVNFSIWLMQIVALILFSTLATGNVTKKTFFCCLIFLTPAYVLQNMTGGRSGLLGTLLLICVFAYRRIGVKALFISLLWLYLIALMVAKFHPLITTENNLNIFRNLALSSNFEFGEIIAWLDRLSSYRLSIIVTALSTLSIKDFLLGKGLGNFVGWAPAYPQLGIIEVHSVLLKILGEYGVFGFLSALFLVIWPFTNRPRNERHFLALYLLAIYFVVATLHPDLMITAVNVSLIYLACYAYSFSAHPEAVAAKKAAFA